LGRVSPPPARGGVSWGGGGGRVGCRVWILLAEAGVQRGLRQSQNLSQKKKIKVVVQKSISAQIRQLTLHISDSKG